MARVFVSYRRADGPYAVNWLADRLATLDSVNHVESAFHDRDLRAGDDFAAALDAEIAEAELVIAVIGPRWLGPEGEPHRTLDESDWVVREIRTALAQGTVVLPVLVDGAAPVLESQLHPDIRALAGLHALPFNDSDELDKIVAHADSHLREIDEERVALAGLAEPVALDPLGQRRLLAGLSLLLATAFGVTIAAVGWSLDEQHLVDDGLLHLVRALLVGVGVYGALNLVYPTAVMLRLGRITELDWRVAGPIAAGWLLVVLVPWMGIVWSALQTVLIDPPASWIVGILALAFAVVSGAFNMEVLLFGVVSTRPRAGERSIAERVTHHAICVDAQRWGLVGLGSGGSLLVFVAAALLAVAGNHGTEDLNVGGAAFVISIGAIMTVALTGAHLWTTARLDARREAIDDDVRRLPSWAAANARVALPASVFLPGGPGLRAVIAAPLATAVLGAALAVAWPLVA